MADLPPPQESPSRRPEALIDNVLLIDGDNDPHLPADFPISERSLVRVFLRLGGKIPRQLERRLGDLPFLVVVVTTEPGANAADFVMSHHAGILHATLPMHLPFVMVTNDKALGAIAQELQRLGRQAAIWTSHDKPQPASRSRRAAAEPSSESPARGRGRGRRRGGRGRTGGRAAPKAAAATTPAAWESAEPIGLGKPEPEAVPAPSADAVPASAETSADPKLAEVAASYAARLGRIKDPPSRLKTLLNDIKNRTKSSGVPPEAVIEELKRSHGVVVDGQGRVSRRK
jgi:hypothetical protein